MGKVNGWTVKWMENGKTDGKWVKMMTHFYPFFVRKTRRYFVCEFIYVY